MPADATAMSLSGLRVMSNAPRLNPYDMRGPSHDDPVQQMKGRSYSIYE